VQIEKASKEKQNFFWAFSLFKNTAVLRLRRKKKENKRITKMVRGGLAQVGGKAVFASAAQLSPPLAPSRLRTVPLLRFCRPLFC